MNDRPDPDDALAGALRRSRVLEDAPEALIRRAIDVFQPRRRAAVEAPAAGGLRRLVAALGFDSLGLAPQAAGLRALGDGTRQMLFTADGRDVDLRIRPAPGGHGVGGQVLGPDEAGRVAIECGAYRAETAWNELAEFSFEGVPAGRCRIVLRSADWELALPEFELPGEPGSP